MLRYAGRTNYNYVPEMLKHQYSRETADGIMDVFVLNRPKHASAVGVIGIYRETRKLGLYQFYRDGVLSSARSFSNYKVTDSGRSYPFTMSYTKYDSKLPTEIEDKISKGELAIYDREVLDNQITTFEHSWNWELEEVKIDPIIPADVFEFEFPPGTEIVDSSGAEDITYTVEIPVIRTLEEVTSPPDGVLPPPETPRSPTPDTTPMEAPSPQKKTWRFWGGVLVAVILLLIIGVQLRARHRNQKRS